MTPESVRRAWAERDGEYAPRYYAYYGADETSGALRTALDAAVGPDASVLELGCSAGRHLAHLHEHGYRDLAGIDINETAREVLRETYPELAAAGRFYWAAISDVIAGFEAGAFDAVYSVETLQHIHPDDAWVFDEVTRIADGAILTAEIERRTRTDTDTEPGAGTGTGTGTGAGAPTDCRSDASPGEGDDRGVNYVDEDVPLYYRDWGRVFADRGAVEVETERVGRDTLRVFRAPGA